MFTIGADPELFLYKKGKLISAVGLIGGTKQEPLPLTPVGHAVQEDNVSVEFNIPPSNNKQEFLDNINYVLYTLEDEFMNMGLVFARKVASASFPESQLQTLEAQTFGCEPDFNAWTLEVNPKPFCKDENLRSCGGHIHVGSNLDKVELIRAMDLMVGVPSIVLDEDNTRRQLYGKAGAFRPKDYGVEYRTVSNFWIWEKHLIEWVYEQTAKAVAFVEAGNKIPERVGRLIQQTINTGDVNGYLSLAQTYPAIKLV